MVAVAVAVAVWEESFDDHSSIQVSSELLVVAVFGAVMVIESS